MTDLLAGWRERINRGEVAAIWWMDVGQGQPVETGQTFELRSCAIEFTRVHRAKKDGRWIWRAEFTRISRNADPVHLLAKRGGYTSRDSDALGHTDEVERSVLEKNLGRRPPEPEGVPPADVKNYIGSTVARARYEAEMTERRLALDELPIDVRVRRVLAAAEAGEPVGRQVRAILGKLTEAERKMGLRRAA